MSIVLHVPCLDWDAAQCLACRADPVRFTDSGHHVGLFAQDAGQCVSRGDDHFDLRSFLLPRSLSGAHRMTQRCIV